MTATCLFLQAAAPSGSMRAEPAASAPSRMEAPPTPEVLSAGQRQAVDRTVDRALAWIARQQQNDGSFPTLEIGQPGVTALCSLAFLSRGHLPGQGPYGTVLDRAVSYVIDCQGPDGLIARVQPRPNSDITIPQAAAYNHFIGGLLLAEVYGQAPAETNRRIRPAIEAALKRALVKTPLPKRQQADEGGWRYLRPHQSSDSDLSVTSWGLMFLRSCRNAGFEVPPEHVEEALAFVRRCYDPRNHTFWYALRGQEHVSTRAMTGAGILSLSLGGQHQTKEACEAGDWVLAHPYDQYRGQVGKLDRFFYGAFYCSHATFQLGGRYWSEFYPVLCTTLVANQKPDGSWDEETSSDKQFGKVYPAAMAVLALSPPYQLLPIFQR